MPGWCSPVEDCNKRSYPPSPWHISNGFLNEYKLKDHQAIHTGEDVNLNGGADIGATVRAIGDGQVVFAQIVPNTTWIGLVVIRHDHDGTFTCSRYAHLTNLLVKKNDLVTAGQPLGVISDTDVIGHAFPPHLHFDIGQTGDDKLLKDPTHWPSKQLSLEERKALVAKHYQKPGAFLQARLMGTVGIPTPGRTAEPLQPRTLIRMRVNIERVNVRSHRLVANSTWVCEITQNSELVVVDPAVEENNIVWREIAEPDDLRGRWVAERIDPRMDKRTYLVPVTVPVAPAPAPLEPSPPEPAPAPTPTPTPARVDRIRMRVNIERVNLRTHRSTSPAALAGDLGEGAEVEVSNPAVIENQIHWRQIFAPEHLAGTWIAERVPSSVDTRIYLVAVETSPVDAAAFTVAAPMEEPEEIAAAAHVSPTPAPLTGRFQLTTDGSPPVTVLAIDGSARPALGVNIRELAYFDADQFPNVNADDRQVFCETVRQMNMRWVRFFAAHARFSDDEIVAQTRAALDAIAAQGLLAVVVFADSIKNARFYPAGDEDWHKVGQFNHLHKDYFNDGHYRAHYLPLVERLVTTFRHHSGVGMWQLMNEPAIYPDPAGDADVKGFARFVDEVSARVYELDKTHPISIGLINVAHIMPPERSLDQFAAEFYAQRRHIHVVSCHCYQNAEHGDHMSAWDHEDRADADVRAAAKTGRAVFWTEFGASKVSDRKLSTERFLNRHLREQRASGALQWGFMIGPDFAPDKGVGDKDFGFSNAPFNPQFEDLKQLFISFEAN